MGESKYSVKSDIIEEMMGPGDEEMQFYLEEMQKMNNQMIDMQRELNRALSESKKMQEELKENEDLRVALEASEKAGQAKMDFMSRMSHDMRTPMNVIMGLTAATLDEAENPTAVRENMAHIRTASDFMLGLINDILDMAKVEQGALVLNLEPYSYNEFAVEMRTMFQTQCDAKNITLTAKKATQNPVVLADKMRLKQIFFNLVSNAIKYTPAGGTISVGAYHVEMDETGKRISVEYHVIDNGIGMSEEFQKHLFEPFAQEDNKVSPEYKGSGLGLSITKRLVDQMGGTIQVESKKGLGTTFRVGLSFELIEQNKSPIDHSVKKEDHYIQLQGKNILLAEDHPLNAQIARKILEKQGMNVMHAANGKIAVDMFASAPAGSLDAILMDIRMPEMSGIEAARAIRGLDNLYARTIPIIALSANAYEKDVEESIAAGMNAHLAKPIEPQAVYEALDQFINQ